MIASKTDIRTKQDVDALIRAFYARVREDGQLAPHFQNIDWEHHTPFIVNFWSMLLLADNTYNGNPFSKHLHLKLVKKDFDQWLLHFHQTVDDLFTGEIATEAKQRASNIAAVFQFKLGVH